jgi:hypothetical protein
LVLEIFMNVPPPDNNEPALVGGWTQGEVVYFGKIVEDSAGLKAESRR